METLVTFLEEHPLLQGISPEDLRIVVGCATTVRFNPGEMIFHEGDEANQFYIIRQGLVEISVGTAECGAVVIQTLGERDILGWSWLVPPYRWHFDARCVEITRAVALDGKALRVLCEEDYRLGYELSRRCVGTMEERLHGMRLRLGDVQGIQGVAEPNRRYRKPALAP